LQKELRNVDKNPFPKQKNDRKRFDKQIFYCNTLQYKFRNYTQFFQKANIIFSLKKGQKHES
jgi:hypothetical protein